MNKLTGINIIDFYKDAQPRMIWEMDQSTLTHIRNVKDGAGVYFWLPIPNQPTAPGTLMGLPISIAEEENCFQLLFLFPDGHRHVIEMEGGEDSKKYKDACLEWLKSCSCAPQDEPFKCESCTSAFCARIKKISGYKNQ